MRRAVIQCGFFVAAMMGLSYSAGAVNMEPDPVGTWRFKKQDRTVKLVLLGGSIANDPTGFSRFLGAVCKNVELKNKSRIGFGAQKLKGRFRRQVMKNRHLRLDHEKYEYWLMYFGGMNSVGYPAGTIRSIASTFELAHKRRMKVIALSLTPWGSNRDKKWFGIDGLLKYDKTRIIVDFVLGKNSRLDVLGPPPAKSESFREQWLPEELPDAVVNLYDGPLRHHDAPLRDKEKLLAQLQKRKKWRRLFPDADAAAERASTVPQWFLRPELKGFDHVHPNRRGQKVIAKEICIAVPENWSCDCAMLDTLEWKKGKGLIVVEPPKSP